MVVVLKYVMVDADRYCRDQGVVVVDESDSERILRHRTKVWCGGYIPGRGLRVARVLLVPVLFSVVDTITQRWMLLWIWLCVFVGMRAVMVASLFSFSSFS